MSVNAFAFFRIFLFQTASPAPPPQSSQAATVPKAAKLKEEAAKEAGRLQTETDVLHLEKWNALIDFFFLGEDKQSH